MASSLYIDEFGEFCDEDEDEPSQDEDQSCDMSNFHDYLETDSCKSTIDDMNQECQLLGIDVSKNAFEAVKYEIGCAQMSYDEYARLVDEIQKNPDHT